MDAHRSTYVLQVACKLTLIPLASGGQALRPIGQRLRQQDDLAGVMLSKLPVIGTIEFLNAGRAALQDGNCLS